MLTYRTSNHNQLQKQETLESPKNSPRLTSRKQISRSITNQNSLQKQGSLASEETITPLHSFGKRKEFFKQHSLNNSSLNWNENQKQQTFDRLSTLNSESLISKKSHRDQLNHQSSLEFAGAGTNRLKTPLLNRRAMGKTFDLTYGGKSSEERARESYELATQFKSKSWLKQVRIGSQIALMDFRRSLNSTSQESPNEAGFS